MTPKITLDSEKEYILVEPEAGDFWEICECLGRELKVPEYAQTNAIWSFPDVPLGFNYEDLYRIKEIVSKNYPEHAKPDRKVAIVVRTSFHMALAREYVKIAQDLPINFKIFADMRSAEEWIG